MKAQYIKDLTPGNAVDCAFALCRAERCKKQNGDAYLRGQLQDRTGTIAAVAWTLTEGQIGAALASRYVHVRGTVGRYKDGKQVTISSPPEDLGDPEDLSDFTPAAALPRAELCRRLNAHLDTIRNPHLDTLLRVFFDDPKFRRHFDQAPAAMGLHHACAHGLLQHTLEVTDLAAAIADVQSRWGYPAVSHDLVVGGALLHDIGKVYELTWDGPEYGYTRRGQLYQHIILGFQIVSKKIAALPGFPPDLAEALLHGILSHHGKEEHGSPVAPQLPEAQIVHMADALDVQLFYMMEARAGADGDTAWHPALEGRVKTSGRRVYSGALDFAPDFSRPAPAPTLLPVFRLASREYVAAFETRHLPLRGRTAAGPPVLADDRVEEELDVASEGLPADPGLFLLRVDGESMTGDGIRDGDLIVVRPQQHHEPDAVLVCLNLDDDTVTIKRVERTAAGGLRQLSSNPAFAPIPIADPERFRVSGRVLGVVRDVPSLSLTNQGTDTPVPQRTKAGRHNEGVGIIRVSASAVGTMTDEDRGEDIFTLGNRLARQSRP